MLVVSSSFLKKHEIILPSEEKNKQELHTTSAHHTSVLSLKGLWIRELRLSILDAGSSRNCLAIKTIIRIVIAWFSNKYMSNT